jgi:hypothetical protein
LELEKMMLGIKTLIKEESERERRTVPNTWEWKMTVGTEGILKNLPFGLGLFMRTSSAPFVIEREFEIKGINARSIQL